MIVIFTSKLNVEPLVVLTILAIVYGVGANEDPVFVVETVNKGFGDTAASIANVIFAGCIISVFLKESNSAQGLKHPLPHPSLPPPPPPPSWRRKINHACRLRNLSCCVFSMCCTAMAIGLVGLVGNENVELAMALLGFVVAIPVFADSSVILLSPLSNALSVEAGKSQYTVGLCMAYAIFSVRLFFLVLCVEKRPPFNRSHPHSTLRHTRWYHPRLGP